MADKLFQLITINKEIKQYKILFLSHIVFTGRYSKELETYRFLHYHTDINLLELEEELGADQQVYPTSSLD